MQRYFLIGNAIKHCFYECPYAWLAWPPTAWHAAQAAHESNPGTLCQRPSGAAPGQLANAANAGNAGNVAMWRECAERGHGASDNQALIDIDQACKTTVAML